MPLQQQQMEQLRGQLEARHHFLEEDIQREVQASKDFKELDDGVMDPADSSMADLVVDLSHAEIGRDVTELRAIEAAQQRLGSGEYGYCESCGADIPFERLQVQPTATRCAPCQTNYEKTHADGLRGTTL